jgi:carboxypeptidase Q
MSRVSRPWHLPLVSLCLAFAILPLVAQTTEPVDWTAVQRLKDEGLNRSRVMDTISHLTDLHGPRLTNSPNMHRAAEFVRARMNEFGIESVQFEAWGHFGRGWENERTSIHVTAPNRWPVVGFSKAWAPGTDGPRSGPVIYAPITTREQLEGYRGSLKGKWVLLSPARQVASLFSAPARRYTDEELRGLTTYPPSAVPPPTPEVPQPAQAPQPAEAFRRERMAFLVAEGVAGIVEVSSAGRGDNLTVLIGGPLAGEGTREPKEPPPLPHLVFAAEHYHRIVRLLALKQNVTLEADIRNRVYDDNLGAYNIVAELAGSDLSDEVVLLGAHFDSWHIGTGATDNGASSAVVMEAMRLIKTTGLPLRRTVRMVLWTGEEQGLLGSRAYVSRHFGGRGNTPATPAHAKVSAYFNQDNGAGSYRGIYLQRNDAVRPIFEAWMTPFADFGITTASIRPTAGTDHVAFDEAGLPGFQFIQDPMDYSTWTHHTQQDLYERINPHDVMKNAVIMAAFVYHAANRDAPLPRRTMR